MKFVLFDIDGTLIDSGGAGTRSLDLAFQEVFSIRNAFAGISMAGKTDLQIAREGMIQHGIDPGDGIIPEFLKTYVRYLHKTIDPEKGHVKKGIREAITALSQDKTCVLGLLTGNIEEGARIKLEAFGLHSYFGIGAYGSDNEDRNRLLPIAVEKLHKGKALQIGYKECVVIGDTPRDIECSKPFGAMSIAVATGPYTYSALTAAGADLVFHDLSDTDGLLSAIRRPAR